METGVISYLHRCRRLLFVGTLAAVISLLLSFSLSHGAAASAVQGAETTSAKTVTDLYLPILFGRGKLSDRLGFGATMPSIGPYPEIASLKAGWYVDWRVQEKPTRPNMMEYVQTIRVHQKLTCPLGSADAHDRLKCPYAIPYAYLISPDLTQITAAARANPGSMWLIGNEMDRRDWMGGAQDEMLPETYAVVYHDLYHHIKTIDPRARIAIGGVIQPTPLRLEYLSKVWNTYASLYKMPMPVDVWNVHNFILKEKLNDYGAGIPPGSTATQGVVYSSDWSHVDMSVFDQQIYAFRNWMKARGEQEKPLIVSEYGVLYTHDGMEDPARVEYFMEATFNYFLNTKDCTIGFQADGCRLVQRWSWYSLDDPGTDFNQYGSLFNPSTKQITNTGIRYRNFSLKFIDQLAQ
jgi:hypothetical protein